MPLDGTSPKDSGFRWTDENVAELRRLAPDYSSSQIAGRLGCSRSAVIGKLSRLGISRTPRGPQPFQWTKDLDDQLYALHLRAFSDRTIATILGCAVSALRKRRQKFGEKPVPPGAEPNRYAIRPKHIPRRLFRDADSMPTPDDVWTPLPTSMPVTLAELTASSCRWPCGDPLSPAFRFCGAPAIVGKSYCKCHCAIAFQRAA